MALPPLYRLTQGNKSIYAADDADRERLLKKMEGKGKIDISRFKGLGEMPAAQLKETTMDPDKRTLLRITVPDAPALDGLVDDLMGRNVEPRFRFIQENAKFADAADVDV